MNMRLRIVLVVSLLLNAGLLVSVFYRTPPAPPAPEPAPAVEAAAPASQMVRTNVVVRRQNVTWQDLESTNYLTFMANLRAIGCPESTVRDIITGEVNALYDRKRITDIVTPEQQWWRSSPDQQVVMAAMDQMRALETERRNLLIQLLGPSAEAASSWDTAAFNMRLDGPVLGTLTAEAKQNLREVENQLAARRQEYMTARQQAGQPIDRNELVRLEQESRKELAKILSPAQLEEYSLRYSEVAQNLRREFQGFEVTPEEFRNIFRSRETLAQQAQIYSEGEDAVSVRMREEYDRQRQTAVKQALGEERYQLYQYSQDPLFRQAQASAQTIGAPAETVLPIYQINQAAEAERQRLRNDTALSGEQRAAALAATLEQQQASLRKVLGDAAYERYRQGQSPGQAQGQVFGVAR